MNKTKQYSPEIRERAVRLAEERGNRSAVARELDIRIMPLIHRIALVLCLGAGMAVPQSTRGQQPASSIQTAQYGVGLRFRGLFIPKRVFEHFVEVAPSGVAQPGFGLELLRRKRRFEASFGVGWARLHPRDGIWLDDPAHNPSLVEFDNFSWLSLDLTAVWKRPLNPAFAFRYGMGVGLGILMGDVLETDYVCAGTRYDLDSCTQNPVATDVRHALDLPPVVPVTNALIGLQYTPSDRVAVNLDGGWHTTLFAGVSVAYFFE
ncbi:MAG: transposase [Rhodothermales bacterium]